MLVMMQAPAVVRPGPKGSACLETSDLLHGAACVGKSGAYQEATQFFLQQLAPCSENGMP